MSRSKPPEDGKHFVEDGEWVGSIAAAYGYFDWDKDVWQHAQNAKLKELRQDPRVLAPGDELFIPPWEEKKESCATEKKHKFKVKTPSEVLRIRLLDEEGKPLKDEDYQLDLDYDPGGGVFKQANPKTDNDGVVTESIPSTAISGRLRLPRLKQEIALRLGYLTPMDLNDEQKLIRGVQERLSALGFAPGPVDGINGPQTRAAVMSFQQFCQDNKDKNDSSIIDSGPVDGIVGKTTKAALLSYYGC